MNGMLDLETLKGLVERGEIDTVVVAMVDMQGRLVGKRVSAPFFLDSVVEETHGCDYLLTVDIEMEPVPGYEAASWDLGYGDFVLKPDMASLRRTPWLEGTALILCDVLDHRTHDDLPHSPRAILRRQLKRLAERGWKSYMASELEFYVIDEPYDVAREKNYRNLKLKPKRRHQQTTPVKPKLQARKRMVLNRCKRSVLKKHNASPMHFSGKQMKKNRGWLTNLNPRHPVQTRKPRKLSLMIRSAMTHSQTHQGELIHR